MVRSRSLLYTDLPDVSAAAAYLRFSSASTAAGVGRLSSSSAAPMSSAMGPSS